MAALARHAAERHAPPDGRLLRYTDGHPVTYRRYDGLWVRIGRHLPWARTQQVSTHWLRHTTLTWVEGRGVASDATFRHRREAGRARVPALPGFRLRGALATGHAVISEAPVPRLHWMTGCGIRISCTQ